MTIPSCCASGHKAQPVKLAAPSAKGQPAAGTKPSAPASPAKTTASAKPNETAATQASSKITPAPAISPKASKDTPKTAEKPGFFRSIANWFKNFFNGLWKDIKRIFSGPVKEEPEQAAQPQNAQTEQKPEEKPAPAAGSCCQQNG